MPSYYVAFWNLENLFDVDGSPYGRSGCRGRSRASSPVGTPRCWT